MQIDFNIKSNLWPDSSLLNLHSSSHLAAWRRTSQLRHEIMQSLLFVVDKVDIDELFLIVPKIEHLVFKNSTKLQNKFYWVHEKCLNQRYLKCPVALFELFQQPHRRFFGPTSKRCLELKLKSAWSELLLIAWLRGPKIEHLVFKTKKQNKKILPQSIKVLDCSCYK